MSNFNISSVALITEFNASVWTARRRSMPARTRAFGCADRVESARSRTL